MRVLLSPHNDDAELFAAYTCISERPCVVVVLRSQFQDAAGVSARTREAETDAAMRVLGCDWEQWPFPDVTPDWAAVRAAMADLDACCEPEVVYAPNPMFEENRHRPDSRDRPIMGVLQHDVVGWLAGEVFGGRVRYYQTYTRERDRVEEGVPVDPVDGWHELKRDALACYASQIALRSTAHHFSHPSVREWLAA